MTSALERFLRYVRIETASKENVDSTPSSAGQFNLARLLVEELRELGLADAAVDERCYVMATLPDNRPASEISQKRVPVIGFIAHLDTAFGVSGKNVDPQVISYLDGPIILSNGTEIPQDEALESRRGKTLVVADGSTLLGADDKAGIAAIMTALDRLIHERRPDGTPIPHGTIRVCFTPDEEIGRGADFFDIEKFGAACAYTVDGNLPGEINRETFSAEKAVITVAGHDVHPGSAKGVMVNALQILADLLARLPKDRAPETTEGTEPYIHPYEMRGDVSSASADLILRAFSDAEMDENRRLLDEIGEAIRAANPKAAIDIAYFEQYRNMRGRLEKTPEVLEKLEEAVRRAGAVPEWVPVRGGTDGSRLTELGLPCPNIFTGGHHFHSVCEWLCVEDLETSVETLVRLAELYAE